MTEAEPRRRRRWWLGAVLVLVLGAGVAVAWALGAYTDPPDFRRQSSELLEALSSGDADTLERVYDEAAFPFRETILIAGFEDLAERLRGTLGEFRGVLIVLENQRVPSLAGDAATISYRVRYERGITTATISYLRPRGDSDWKLLGLDVAIPPKLADTAEKLAADESRFAAPEAVVELFGRVVEHAAAGEVEAILALASPPFRESVSAETLARQAALRERQLGALVNVVTILDSAQSPERDRARVDALVEFERGRTTASAEFLLVDGQWRLLSLKILVPEPLLPSGQAEPVPAPGH